MFATALVDQGRYLHHYVIKGCANAFPPEQDGKEITGAAANKCVVPMGGWTPGANIVETVPWTGVPIGSAFGIKALTVNVHYNNPGKVAGVVDSSGMRLWYTPNLRNHSTQGLPITQLSVNQQMTIPPGVDRWFVTRTCKLNITDCVG